MSFQPKFANVVLYMWNRRNIISNSIWLIPGPTQRVALER